MSAQLAANFALLGGAGVQRGESGGNVFFARDGLLLDCETWNPSVNRSKIAEIELNVSLRLFNHTRFNHFGWLDALGAQ